MSNEHTAADTAGTVAINVSPQPSVYQPTKTNAPGASLKKANDEYREYSQEYAFENI
jgi:hypothetical protein